MKSILSSDHAEVATQVWVSLGEDGQRDILESVREALKDFHGGEQEELKFSEVVHASWCVGFHYALMAIESGGLKQMRPGGPKENN